jgi:LacI family transcriptional regulator
MGKTIANLYFQGSEDKEVATTPKTISIMPKLLIRSSTIKKG